MIRLLYRANTFKAGTEDGKPVTDHHELYKLGDDWRIEKTMSGYTGEYY